MKLIKTLAMVALLGMFQAQLGASPTTQPKDAGKGDFTFSIHFDPKKTKQENGTNYYGIDYTLKNNGLRPLGRSLGSINLYTIDSFGKCKSIHWLSKPALFVTYQTPPLLLKGQTWKGVAWVPVNAFESVKSGDKLFAARELYYLTNHEGVDYMLPFKVHSPAIPVGDIHPISTNTTHNQ